MSWKHEFDENDIAENQVEGLKDEINNSQDETIVEEDAELINSDSPEVAKVESEEKKPQKKDSIMDWVKTIALALVIALFIQAFIGMTTKVNMSSMENTVFQDQRLVTYKLGYFFSSPQRGDIVVFVQDEGLIKGYDRILPFPNPGEKDLIKRVIGLPNETIDIKDGAVYINGEKLEEPYVKGVTDAIGGISFPVTVKEGEYFVMGDNRPVSRDSRDFGFVKEKKIKGKAIFRIWPLDKVGGLN